MIRVYLRKNNETIKLTRDECDNVSIESINKGERFFTWLGYSNNDLEDTITDYMNKGYKLKSIFAY